MSETVVQEQVKIIEKATKEASQSKQAALQFLEEAGIIKKEYVHTAKNGHSTKKK